MKSKYMSKITNCNYLVHQYFANVFERCSERPKNLLSNVLRSTASVFPLCT